jgi:O-antigen/teichoic acid export membrane protein
MAINFVIFNFLRQLTTFLISIYLIASLDAGVTGRFIGMLLSNILFSFVAIYLTMRHCNFIFQKSILTEGLSFSIPILIATIISTMYISLDKILLLNYISLSELGLYTLAASIASLPNFVSLGYYKATEPIIYQKLIDKEFQTIVNDFLSFQIIGIFWISFLISLFAREIVEILFSNSFLDSSKYIPIFLIVFLLNAHRRILTTVLHAFKVTKYDMVISLATLIFFLIFFYILVPKNGAVGALYSLILAALASLLITYAVVLRYKRLNLFTFKILIASMMIASTVFLQYDFEANFRIIMSFKILLFIGSSYMIGRYLYRNKHLIPN